MALDTDRAVIVVSHAPLFNAGLFGTQDMPNPFKPYDDLLNAPRVQYAVKHAGNVVMLLAGHLHYDNLLYNEGILTVTTLSSYAQEWAPTSPRREVGTVTETAFDVFSIKDRTVYITRFGAGEDRRRTPCAALSRRLGSVLRQTRSERNLKRKVRHMEYILRVAVHEDAWRRQLTELLSLFESTPIREVMLMEESHKILMSAFPREKHLRMARHLQ